MLPLHDQHGTTLLEALLAAGLLTTLVAGTAVLIALAQRIDAQTEEATTASVLAAARLQALRAIPWRYEIDGTTPEVPALAYSPPDALEHDTSGYSDVLDRTGQPLRDHEDDGEAFVRRWAVTPVASGSPQARALEVCVFSWPAERHPVPIVCLADVRTRQP